MKRKNPLPLALKAGLVIILALAGIIVWLGTRELPAPQAAAEITVDSKVLIR